MCTFRSSSKASKHLRLRLQFHPVLTYFLPLCVETQVPVKHTPQPSTTQDRNLRTQHWNPLLSPLLKRTPRISRTRTPYQTPQETPSSLQDGPELQAPTQARRCIHTYRDAYIPRTYMPATSSTHARTHVRSLSPVLHRHFRLPISRSPAQWNPNQATMRPARGASLAPSADVPVSRSRSIQWVATP